MVPLETFDTVSYAHSIATMAVSLAVSEILMALPSKFNVG